MAAPQGYVKEKAVLAEVKCAYYDQVDPVDDSPAATAATGGPLRGRHQSAKAAGNGR